LTACTVRGDRNKAKTQGKLQSLKKGPQTRRWGKKSWAYPGEGERDSIPNPDRDRKAKGRSEVLEKTWKKDPKLNGSSGPTVGPGEVVLSMGGRDASRGKREGTPEMALSQFGPLDTFDVSTKKKHTNRGGGGGGGGSFGAYRRGRLLCRKREEKK